MVLGVIFYRSIGDFLFHWKRILRSILPGIYASQIFFVNPYASEPWGIIFTKHTNSSIFISIKHWCSGGILLQRSHPCRQLYFYRSKLVCLVVPRRKTKQLFRYVRREYDVLTIGLCVTVIRVVPPVLYMSVLNLFVFVHLSPAIPRPICLIAGVTESICATAVPLFLTNRKQVRYRVVRYM